MNLRHSSQQVAKRQVREKLTCIKLRHEILFINWRHFCGTNVQRSRQINRKHFAWNPWNFSFRYIFFHEKILKTMLWHYNARVNSHQRWKQTRFRVWFHLWCELTSTMNVTEWQVSGNSCDAFAYIIRYEEQHKYLNSYMLPSQKLAVWAIVSRSAAAKCLSHEQPLCTGQLAQADYQPPLWASQPNF